ncbi:MAG: tRNA glutamyl-Q(34) synthetase GluQRS [Thiobacillus sp.]|nr:tRNA glutamyl-Q(34) synthetase GluQRS [Thiobacillus sp.]
MTAYRGRFAPTPSGQLHFGSLVAALGSCLDARSQSGEWLLRMEDVDPPRVVPGAADAILRTLEAYGFEWDGEVMWQGRRAEAYAAALERLREAGQVYACACSRKTLAEGARRGVEGFVYPGTCRGGQPRPGMALRLLVPAARVVFQDGLLGRVACDVARECGDFVLRRADGVYAYQLAVVVDDAEQGITHVVRGADLLASTPRQLVLQAALGYSPPSYLHLPLALDPGGFKLSKQTLAAPLDDARPLPALRQAAEFLGMGMEPVGSLAEFWDQARASWCSTIRLPVRGKRLEAQTARPGRPTLPQGRQSAA